MSDPSTFPSTKIRVATYENVIADCPHCGFECIFNRVSDLKDSEPIGHARVRCERPECGKVFDILGDTIGTRFEMLLYDCPALLERKQYMACVLNVAQAHECFFYAYLRSELLFRPFASSEPDLDLLNRLSIQLDWQLERQSLSRMRNIFFQCIIIPTPASLADAEPRIRGLRKSAEVPANSVNLAGVGDGSMEADLDRLRQTRIGDLRNEVVHKIAKRPTRDEAERAYDDGQALVGLGLMFGVYEDINIYQFLHKSAAG